MTNEEQEVVETVKPTEVEPQESTETVEETSTPTVEDYEKLRKENATLVAQKEHWKKKATTIKVEEPIKINETPTGLSREEAILIAKGVSETVINEASVIAKAKNISLGDAMKDPLIEAYSQKIKADEKKEKAQLGASKGSGKYGGVDLINAVGMTEEEHRKAIGM
jgi:hypothetical protein